MLKVAVIGLGAFGMSVLKALVDVGAEIIAIDQNMQKIEEVQDMVSFAVKMDSTDETALLSQGVHEVDIAVVCIGEGFEANILTGVTLKNLGVKKVISRATREIEKKILNCGGFMPCSIQMNYSIHQNTITICLMN